MFVYHMCAWCCEGQKTTSDPLELQWHSCELVGVLRLSRGPLSQSHLRF